MGLLKPCRFAVAKGRGVLELGKSPTGRGCPGVEGVVESDVGDLMPLSGELGTFWHGLMSGALSLSKVFIGELFEMPTLWRADDSDDRVETVNIELLL